MEITMNTESTASTTITHNPETQPISVSEIIKPQRAAFYRDVVLNAAGEVVEEATWMPMIGDQKLSGRALAGKLRRNGLQMVHLFDKPGFEQAKTSYRQASRAAKITERDSLIVGAFQKAGIEVEPHIERALKDLLPVLSCVTPSKASVVLKKVVRTVAHGAGLVKNQGTSEPSAPAAA
jgi:hypothetical protein